MGDGTDMVRQVGVGSRRLYLQLNSRIVRYGHRIRRKLRRGYGDNRPRTNFSATGKKAALHFAPNELVVFGADDRRVQRVVVA